MTRSCPAADQFELPKRSDKQYAVLSAMVGAVTRDVSVDRWNAAWTILQRAADQGGADIAAATSKTLIHLKTNWQRNHGSDLPTPTTSLMGFADILAEAGLLKMPSLHTETTT